MIKLETLENLLKLGYELQIRPRLFNQIQVQVGFLNRDRKRIEITQMIPFDTHLEKIDGVVNYCINKVTDCITNLNEQEGSNIKKD